MGWRKVRIKPKDRRDWKACGRADMEAAKLLSSGTSITDALCSQGPQQRGFIGEPPRPLGGPPRCTLQENTSTIASPQGPLKPRDLTLNRKNQIRAAGCRGRGEPS